MVKPTTFKPNPKEGDTETRTVIALNTTAQAVKDIVDRLENLPAMEKTELRTFTNGKWTDWKHAKT